MADKNVSSPDNFMAPSFEIDDGFYQEHNTEKGPINAFTQIAALDPSPPEHVKALYDKKLLEMRIDPQDRPGTAAKLLEWCEKASTLERHLLACENIREYGGPMATPTQKFLGTGTSTALFPAFVESQIAAGLIATGIVDDVVMSNGDAASNKVTIFDFNDTEAERDLGQIAIGANLPHADITTGEGTLNLRKYGKIIGVPVEVSALANIDVISTMLRRVGEQISVSKSDFLMSVTIAGDGTGRALGGAETNALDTDVAVAGTIAYSDMLDWVYNAGQPYNLDLAVLGSTDLALIANLAEFKDPDVGRSPSKTQFKSPLSLRYIQWDGGVTDSSYVDRLVVGIDSRNGYKGYTWGPNIQNSQDIIHNQSTDYAFSYWWGVAKMDITATQVLDTNTAL